ncbi:MAG: hypothetical protein NC340_07350 [Ruminococcus flavefaciens]|nr:hypothetical protein [Ruminococcus flavefaciens]
MYKGCPFHDSPDTAVITCCHIIEDGEPILYVSHDDDGMWQFLCGKDHELDDARVVSLLDIFSKDNSVGLLSELPQGRFAERHNAHSKWRTYRH